MALPKFHLLRKKSELPKTFFARARTHMYLEKSNLARLLAPEEIGPTAN